MKQVTVLIYSVIIMTDNEYSKWQTILHENQDILLNWSN